MNLFSLAQKLQKRTNLAFQKMIASLVQLVCQCRGKSAFLLHFDMLRGWLAAWLAGWLAVGQALNAGKHAHWIKDRVATWTNKNITIELAKSPAIGLSKLVFCQP
jgi:hypothetical protein